LFADDRAELCWTGEILMIIRAKRFPLNVGEAKIVEAAAIEHRNYERASAATGELTFQQEIRRQLIDATPQLPRRDHMQILGRRWGRRVDHGTVAPVIKTVMTSD